MTRNLSDIHDESQAMFKFCKTEQFKAAIGAAFLIILLGVGTWGLVQDWETNGRKYERVELTNPTNKIDGVVMNTRQVDNLRTMVLMWVSLGIPAAFLVDHIEFVQWVLYNWEPVPPNEIE